MTELKKAGGGVSSSTRGIAAGGANSGGYVNIIDYITIASTGDATDFGDLTSARVNEGNSNSTRGIFMGGSTGSYVNTIDYVTIASAGDAADFGDLRQTKALAASASNGHGGLS